MKFLINLILKGKIKIKKKFVKKRQISFCE